MMLKVWYAAKLFVKHVPVKKKKKKNPDIYILNSVCINI